MAAKNARVSGSMHLPLLIKTPWQCPVWPSQIKKLVILPLVLLGPTSHLPLARTTTGESTPVTEIPDRFFFSRPRGKKKRQSGGEAAFSPAFAISAFIDLHGQNSFENYWIWLGLRFNDYRSLNLDMILKIEF
jgi:hypothetical protein